MKQQALGQLEATFGPEIRRLEALRKVNPAIRDEEIDFFQNQRTVVQEAINHASLALEGIRIIVTA
jgi:ATP-dependent helicase HepA